MPWAVSSEITVLPRVPWGRILHGKVLPLGRVDVSGDRKVNIAEFKNALPLLRRWGLREADDWQRNPQAGFRKLDRDGGGEIRFIEFADWCLKHRPAITIVVV